MGDLGRRGLVNVFTAVLCFIACSSFLWQRASSELTLTQVTGRGRPVELGDEIVYKCIVTHSALLRWAIEPVIPKLDPLKFWPHERAQEPVKIRGNFKANLTESVEASDGSFNMTSYLTITVGQDFRQVRRIECRSTLEIGESDAEGQVVIGFDSKVLSISESQNAILIAVLRIISGGIAAGESRTVHVTSRSGTALGGGVDFDFTQADYTFTDTKTVHYVSVTIVEDFINEQMESFQLLASSSDAGVIIDPNKVDVKIINREPKDINECETNNGGCSHICTDTVGSFRCSCRRGYALASDGKSCNNINECNIKNGGCSHLCTDTVGSFRCSCRHGYALASDGRSCNSINACDTDNGGCSHICTDVKGSAKCSCRRGYVLAFNKRSCNNINECDTNNGGCSHICTDTEGSFRCSCRRGYTLASDGRSCNSINACDTNNGGCSHICTDVDGSARCSCRRGYTLARNGRSCNSINACGTDNGGCSHICTDIDGSARCSCKSGYALASNRKSCNNINECDTNNGGCSHLCTDTVGSFRCSCRHGYTLASNGKRCNNINECKVNNGGCSQICTDMEGSFRCSCEDGYTLASDGRNCTGGMTVQMALIIIILLVIIIVGIIITCAQRDAEDKESTCTKFIRALWTKFVDTIKSFTLDIWLIIIGFGIAILAIVFGPTILYGKGVSNWNAYRMMLALILLVLLAVIIAMVAVSGKRSLKSIIVDGWTSFVDGVCTIIGSLTSIIVNAAGNIIGSKRPKITTHPTDVLDVVHGQQATMEVAASGEGTISYQWNKNGEKIPGENSNRLTILNVTNDDEGEYQCVVSNDAGASVTKTAQLTLLTPPRITTNPADILNATPGKTVTMLCMANGGTLRYQWQKNSKNIPNGTYHTYCITISSADNEGEYQCVVSNEVGKTISDKARLTVSIPMTELPKIISHPTDIRNAAPGKQITLEVIACGIDITYQWRKNGDDISGATSRIFTIFDVTDEDEGNYNCVVSNDDGEDVSDSATVTVCMRLQVHYIFCDKLFSKDVKAKVVTNLNPLSTTMKDLYEHIRTKEDVMEGEAIELFSHEGYPLNANVHTLKCTLKEWKVSNDDLFYVFVRQVSQPAWKLLDTPVESPVDHTTGKDELHIMSSLFELFTIRTDLDCDTSQIITRKVASAVLLPSNYILLYTRGKMLLNRHSDLESGDILTLVLKRPYRNHGAQGTEYGKRTYNPNVLQTDRGLSKFFSILKFICSKKRESGDKDFRSRLLSYLLHLTNCPPMVHALKLLFENSKLSLPCWVALVEGCYQLFYCFLIQFDIEFQDADEKSLSNVFEFSDYFWGLILSKSKTYRVSIEYKKQTLMCPISELKMSLPVTIPGHDVIEYQSVSEYVKDEEMTVDFFVLRMLVYHPWDCDEDVYVRTGEVPISRQVPEVQKPCKWEDIPTFLGLLLIKPPNYINSECLTYILHGYVVYFVGFLSPDDKQDGKRRIYDPIKCDFTTYTESTLGTFAKTTTVVNDLKTCSGSHSQESMTVSEPEVAITVLLDCSGSMRTVFDNKTRMDAAKEFFKILVTHCCKIYKLKCAMRLMAYSTDTTELLPMTIMDSSSILRFEVALKNAVAEGETALYQAIEEALEGYTAPGQYSNCRRYIVCLCDGKNNKGEFDPALIKNLQAAEVVVDAIIIGNKGDTNLRKIIEETGGECCHPRSISEIWPWKTSSPFHAHHTQAQRVQDIC